MTTKFAHTSSGTRTALRAARGLRTLSHESPQAAATLPRNRSPREHRNDEPPRLRESRGSWILAPGVAQCTNRTWAHEVAVFRVFHNGAGCPAVPRLGRQGPHASGSTESG